MPLRCKVFARLNNCANCDEADVSFVRTQKNAKSLICMRLQKGAIESWRTCRDVLWCHIQSWSGIKFTLMPAFLLHLFDSRAHLGVFWEQGTFQLCLAWNMYWHQVHSWSRINLRGNCTPDQKLAGFVLYLKIINTFLKTDICILS